MIKRLVLLALLYSLPFLVLIPYDIVVGTPYTLLFPLIKIAPVHDFMTTLYVASWIEWIWIFLVTFFMAPKIMEVE